jgi:uncharacterized delta-60 repeat protein
MAALFVACLCTITAGSAFGAAGDLDPSFGNHGKVLGPFGDDGGTSFTSALVLLPDGKLVVGRGDGWSAFKLTRYNSDGSVDGSFGTGGTATTPVGTPGPGTGVAALVVQSDGKLVAAGPAFGIDVDFALVRYDADGSLDGSFGSGGIVTTPVGPLNDEPRALVLQADGKIVAAGLANNGVGNNADFALVRYDSDGTLDTSFGIGGKVTTAVGTVASIASALVLQPDGKLIAAGGASSGGGVDFAVVRYAPDGSMDGSFGTAGIVTLPVGGCCFPQMRLVLQPDGKLLTAGSIGAGTLIRLNGDGSLDGTFGSGGWVTTPVGDVSALVLQPDGKLIAGADGFLVLRYDADGTLDDSFGEGGIVSRVHCETSFLSSMALQSDGKLVAAGHSLTGHGEAVALVRYLADGGSGDCGNGIVEAGESCDDGNLLQCDCCSSVCQKPSTCRQAEKSLLLLKDSDDDEKDKLIWKWLDGDATTTEELADPTYSAEYALCIYSGTAEALLAEASPPPGFFWRPTGSAGYKFKSPSLFHGLTKVVLKSGVQSKAKALVKGKGSSLPDAALGNLPLPVTARLVNWDTGVCMEAVYGASEVLKDDIETFKAKKN